MIKTERTLVLLKPEVFISQKPGLPFEILGEISKWGLELLMAKVFNPPSRELVERHYNKEEKWINKVGQRTVELRRENNFPITKEAYDYGLEALEKTFQHMSSGRVLALVLTGPEAVSLARDKVGVTDPCEAENFTIRKLFALDSLKEATLESRALYNVIHCSDSLVEAEREIGLWFEEEIKSESHEVKIQHEVVAN